MDVTPLVRKGQQIIQGYSGGVFKVSGISYPHALIVFPEKSMMWDVHGALDVEAFTLQDFQPLIDKSGEIDVILLGCGPQMKFLPSPLKKALKSVGLHVETMDTGAACRTYNVLMAEGRRVVLAALPA